MIKGNTTDKFESVNVDWEKDAAALLEDLASGGIPVTPAHPDVLRDIGVVAYCYDKNFCGYTSDDPFAKPLIHQSLYDIVVKKHNGSIHFSDEGDRTVLFLPDVRDVGDRGDRYMVYFWNK